MRGDRPSPLTPLMIQSPATPHARGSTSIRQRPGPTLPGYPACAGIDPVRQDGHGSTSRLPRMRGDRPFHLRVTSCAVLATPHARGSTVQGRRDK